MTGLSSRSFFERASGRRVEQARNNGTPLACILLDVDEFKAYNDTHGAGDEILRCLARILRDRPGLMTWRDATGARSSSCW